MTIETSTYINTLNAALPGAADPESEGDDHIRLIKSNIKATFPNVAGAVSASHTELGYVAGVTSAIQTQLNTVSTTANAAMPKAGGTFTGAITLSADPAASLQPVTLQYLNTALTTNTVTSTRISDSTTIGRTLLTAASASVATAALSPFVASGGSHAAGLVPDPGAVAGTTKFLREDATWQTVSTSAPTRHVTVLTSGTTWTTNANHKWVTVTVIGGGGAGGAAANPGAAGGGGGSGGIATKTYTALTPSTAYTIAVGAAGSPSTFTDGSTLITGGGGSAGTAGTASTPAAGGAGGTATNGDINIAGFPGLPGIGGAANANAASGNGGSTPYGAGGKAIVATGAAGNAGVTGGGGGGAVNNGTGGAGGAGAIIIEEWY